MKIVTFNVRCMYRSLDKENCFIHRAGMILDTIAEEKPDVICFQEATPENMGFLRRYLKPDYTLLLNQREEGLTGEGLAVADDRTGCGQIAYDHRGFGVVDHHTVIHLSRRTFVAEGIYGGHVVIIIDSGFDAGAGIVIVIGIAVRLYQGKRAFSRGAAINIER